MALEGRNVVGQAQVYGQTQNAVNQFAKTLQQQEAKRQAEAKALQDELAKVKVDGVRQGDLPEFTEKYNQWKDSFSKLQGERDNGKKMLLRRDFDRAQQELLQIAADSKNLAKGEDEFSKMLLNPSVRDRYKEDAVVQFQKSRSLSRNDPNFVRDLTKLQHQIDLSKIMQELDKEDDEVMKVSKYGNPVQTPFMQGNRSGVLIEQSRAIDPQQQALRYSSKFDLDPVFRTAVRELFPQLAELPNEQLKQAVIPELVNQRAKTEFVKPVFKEDEDNSMTEYQRRSLALREASSSGVGSGEPISMNIPFANGGNFLTDEYVPISIPKKNFAGSTFIDLKTGKPSTSTLPSSNDYEIVGVTNVPIIKPNTNANKSLWGAIAQPDFANANPNVVAREPMIHVQYLLPNGGGVKKDVLIPYNRLPENVKSSKPVREALANFQPATKSNQPKPIVKKLEGTSAQLEQSAKAKGMTKSEYKKALQNAGYTVIEK
jgi:hypothetical protein